MSPMYQEPAPSLFDTAAGTGARSLAAAVGLLNRTIVQPLLALHRARVTYLELSALDDRQLGDIGLSRGEIEAAMTGRALIAAPSDVVPEQMSLDLRLPRAA
jgi:uncharacterized protein YjiS (DUF1127 family)